ncbi:TonB-dependent receptor [Membranihabitans marinus]|uniref:TonB-dependent receptor n=1 Tax=Membranihabitans marinus TaxID=1227546 RepID=UPI001F3F9441|nr:TonB-dependent receptor [Membranihabitans marinus]
MEDILVTVEMNDIGLESIIKKIELQTQLTFAYLPSEVKKYQDISLRPGQQSVKFVLDQALSSTILGYKYIENSVILFPKEVIKTKDSQSIIESNFIPTSSKEVKKINRKEEVVLKLQPRNFIELSNKKLVLDVSGQVVSEQGEPLIGVNVLVKGTNIGTATDFDGRFTLTGVDEQGVLLISYIGYQSQEIPLNGKSQITVTLVEDSQTLDQVVVVGYGTQKKTSLTSAVSNLNGNDIATSPVANLSNSIGGRLSGLIVRQNTGEPGRDASNIFVRGVSTTGNTQPLLVVDGIPRNFQHLDPNTIESVTVLKDAAAVAPYGVAGANGVILVTTKKGQKGEPSITYNGYYGFQNPTVLPEFPSAFEYAQLKNQASINVGGNPLYSETDLRKFKDGSDPDSHPTQNIYDLLFEKNTPLTSHNIEVTGGTEKLKYYSSVGYQYQAGLWKPTNQERYNYSLNLESNVTNSTVVSFSVTGREQINTSPPISTGRIFELIHYAPPTTPILFSNGESGTYVWNNVHGSGSEKVNTSQIFSQLSIKQNLPFVKGLNFKGTIAFDPTLIRTKSFRTPSHLWSVDTTQSPYVFIDGIFEQTKPSLDQSMVYNNQLTYQASLNYGNSFGKNNLNALLVYEAKSNNSEEFGAARRNYNLTIDELSLGSSSLADLSNYGISSSARQLGLVYRVSYDFAGKYLFEASGRYDGHYYFSPDNRFGFFPAFSAGWRLSEEKFLKENTWLDNLKLRVSYGESGALAGSAFQYLSLFNVYGPAAVIDGVAVQAASEGLEPNPNITWERAQKSNVGFEINLLRGLFNLEMDLFYELRNNMLTSPTVVVPAEYGVGLSQVNAGKMSNQGLDLNLTSFHKLNQDINISFGGNFTYAKNKLIEIFESDATYSNPNRKRTGRPLGTEFGYEAVGYFQVDDFDSEGNLKSGIATQPWGQVFPGDVRYKDVNGDGKINLEDEVPIGEADVPQIIYGLFLNADYKKLTLDVLFQGAAKTNIYGPSGYWHPFNNGRSAYVSNLDYWTEDNPNASHARLTPSPTANNSQKSSYLMFNSKYIRLKSITLAYTLPSAVNSKLSAQNLRVYFSAQNLLTFTPIINYDPEIINSQGLDYPQQKVVTIGLNLTF